MSQEPDALEEVKTLFRKVVEKKEGASFYHVRQLLDKAENIEVKAGFSKWIFENYSKEEHIYYLYYVSVDLILKQQLTSLVPLLNKCLNQIKIPKNYSSILMTNEILGEKKCPCTVYSKFKIIPSNDYPSLETVFYYDDDNYLNTYQVRCTKCEKMYDVDVVDSSAYSKQVVWKNVKKWKFPFESTSEMIDLLNSKTVNQRAKSGVLSKMKNYLEEGRLKYDKELRNLYSQKGGYNLVSSYLLFDRNWFLENFVMLAKFYDDKKVLWGMSFGVSVLTVPEKIKFVGELKNRDVDEEMISKVFPANEK